MTNVSFIQLMRAACGDARALAACARDKGDRNRLATLALLDPDPHPLATLTAFAVMIDPPAALDMRRRTLQPRCPACMA